jgi:hypothetical protein
MPRAIGDSQAITPGQKVPGYYFEAFDEPWKSNKNVAPNDPIGDPWTRSNGAEGHFGLYTYNSNTDTGKIVPKFPLG